MCPKKILLNSPSGVDIAQPFPLQGLLGGQPDNFHKVNAQPEATNFGLNRGLCENAMSYLLAGSNASMPSSRSRAGAGIPSRGAEKCSLTLVK